MALVNNFLYWLLTLHMSRHGQDASATKKYTQDVETLKKRHSRNINLTTNERL